MKSGFYCVISFFILTLVGCKDKPDSQTGNETPEAQVNTFKVVLNAIVKKNDDFCVLYTENGSLEFNDGSWKGVTGMENEQAIEIALPPNVYPTQLRLDLGKGQEQDDIVLKSVKFEYAGKTRELKGAELGLFFRPDPSKCTFDSSTGLIKALVKDGKKQTPSLYPNESIMAAELPKLAM
ncbi:hypothetical protein HYN48_03660 [Flavobacterium magnum]|uniref:Uncharacterized protein n=1 Tax=Flavobacterium magnum TaxID=2162713 RepID=A0A2S0RC99_9FLAO|nr:hypothetical protein [Flavobacterium magnum]AWA29255.1 hypothetical protein HYN48_03660 [Flavobacterium magnum]